MAGELLPPLDLAPPVPHDSTFAERIELWKDLMNTCERFLLAATEMTPALGHATLWKDSE